MLPIDFCKKILNKGTRKFNDEEVKLIREYLYLIGQIELENNVFKKEEDDECNYLLPS